MLQFIRFLVIPFKNCCRKTGPQQIIPFPFPGLMSKIFRLKNSRKMLNTISINSIIIEMNAPVTRNIKSSIYTNVFNIQFIEDFIHYQIPQKRTCHRSQFRIFFATKRVQFISAMYFFFFLFAHLLACLLLKKSWVNHPYINVY